MEVCIAGGTNHAPRQPRRASTPRGSRVARGRLTTTSGPPRTREPPSVMVRPMDQQKDELGYRMALVLFTIAIPIIGAIGAYLASQMPN